MSLTNATKKMWRRIVGRGASDDGDAIFVSSILTMPLFMLLISLMVSTSASISTVSAYDEISQNAVNTAIQSINTNGSLNDDSIKKFATEYRNQITDGKSGLTHLEGSCATEGDGPYALVTLKTKRDAKGNQQTKTIRVSLKDANAGGATFGFDATDTNRYRVFDAEIHQSYRNPFYFPIVPGMNKCFKRVSHVSSISFGSQGDLK